MYNNLQNLLNQITVIELQEAVKEIMELKEKGLQPEGVITRVAREVANEFCGISYSHACVLVTNHVLYTAAVKWLESR